MNKSLKTAFPLFTSGMFAHKEILLIGNFFNESYSMNIYAEELFSNAVTINHKVQLFKPALEKVGKLKLFYKYFYYPLKIVQKRDIDIYHILDHSYGFLVFFLRVFRPGKTIIVSCHDLTPLYDRDNILTRASFSSFSYKLWRAAIKGMAKADLIIANSIHLKNLIIRHLKFDETKIRVVYLGVKPCIENKDLDMFASIPKNGFLILSVGTNEKRKNINTMLKVFAELCHENPGEQLFFLRVGEYLNDEQKKMIAGNNLTSKVIELGGMSYNALSLLYRKCDCLLFVSTDEGFSLTCTEAMNNYLPVIASNVSSLPEVIGDGGILVDPFDTQAIKQALKSIMNGVNVPELKRRAKERASSFTWTNTAKSVLAIYQQTEECKN